MKRIFDPIHRFIELERGEVALLEAAVRCSACGGCVSWASRTSPFPSAEHRASRTRSVRWPSVTRALESLRPARRSLLPERDFAEQRRLLRASLLLHDVGHGPFSHACEAVLGVRHEQRTAEILARRRSPAARRDRRRRGEVLALITGTSTRYPVLRELVSGPNLDADRMDYLLRDAYFTGVVNGRYDAEQLIGSLRVFERSTAGSHSASTAAASSHSKRSCWRAT